MLHVTHKWAKVPANALAIDTTAKSGLHSQLSPFLLAGGELYDGHKALNMENAWQFAKLYAQHAHDDGSPSNKYWEWAHAGWSDPKAHRYPMGRGAKPLHSLWEGKPRGYIEARKRIYAPLYAREVVKTESYQTLTQLLREEDRDIYLRDWDGYDHLAQGLTISQVVNNQTRKMGHAFVLWALLQGEYAELIAPKTAEEPGTNLALAL